MNEAALARAKEEAEAEAGCDLADTRSAVATEKAAAAEKSVSAAGRAAAVAAVESAMADLRAVAAAPPSPAMPVDIWAEVLIAVGTSR